LKKKKLIGFINDFNPVPLDEMHELSDERHTQMATDERNTQKATDVWRNMVMRLMFKGVQHYPCAELNVFIVYMWYVMRVTSQQLGLVTPRRKTPGRDEYILDLMLQGRPWMLGSHGLLMVQTWDDVWLAVPFPSMYWDLGSLSQAEEGEDAETAEANAKAVLDAFGLDGAVPLFGPDMGPCSRVMLLQALEYKMYQLMDVPLEMIVGVVHHWLGMVQETEYLCEIWEKF